MEKNHAYAALEKIGWGRYNLKVFILCGIAWFSYDCWYLNVAFTLLGVGEEFSTPTLYLGLIAACFQCGILIGNLVWGFVSDKKGRRLPYRLSGFFGFFSALCLGFSVHPIMVAFSNLILGFAMSGELTLTGPFFCEFCPPTKRFLLTLMSLFFSFGAMTSTFISLLVSSYNTTDIPTWRIVVIGLSFIQLTSAICRLSLKETPAYLYSKKQLESAEKILNEISEANRGIPFKFEDGLVEFNQSSCNSVLTELEENPPISEILKRLFGRKLRWTTVKLSLAFITANFSYAGFIFFMPEFLKFLSTFEAYLVILIQQFIGIPGVLSGTWLVETRLGRRWTTFWSFMIGGIFSIIFFFRQDLYYVIVTTGVLYFCAYLGYAALLTIGPESFPTQVRSTGYGLVNIISRIGGISAPVIAGVLLETKGGFFIILCLFGAGYITCSLLILTLKETRVKIKDQQIKH